MMKELRAGHQRGRLPDPAMYFARSSGSASPQRDVRTSLDYFLSGRSLPAWITGLAFISANLGALEILGRAANGAEYGAATRALLLDRRRPAMVFLGIVMMPFYYGSKVRSVPSTCACASTADPPASTRCRSRSRPS